MTSRQAAHIHRCDSDLFSDTVTVSLIGFSSLSSRCFIYRMLVDCCRTCIHSFIYARFVRSVDPPSVRACNLHMHHNACKQTHYPLAGERRNLIIWNHSQAFRESDHYRDHSLYMQEAGEPSKECLSYTHDRDYGVFKEYPPGKEAFHGKGWCPPESAQYEGFVGDGAG